MERPRSPPDRSPARSASRQWHGGDVGGPASGHGPLSDFDETLRLRASFSDKELQLLELQREHSQLAARFAEAQDNYEEALEVKDRTIEQLATALKARDEALERQAAGIQAAQTVQLAVVELQARTADVEEAARKRAAAAKQYKQEARRLQAEVAQLQQQLAGQKEAYAQLQHRVAVLMAQHGEHALAEQRHALELASAKAAADGWQARAAAAEEEAGEARRQLEDAGRVRAHLELILKRLVKPQRGASREEREAMV